MWLNFVLLCLICLLNKTNALICYECNEEMPSDLKVRSTGKPKDVTKNITGQDPILKNDPDHWCSDFKDLGVNKTCEEGFHCLELTLKISSKYVIFTK